jgi:HK97 family phage prohead protease
MSDFEKRMVDRLPELVRSDENGNSKLVGYGAVWYREGEAGTEFKLASNVKERIAPTGKSAGTLRLSVDDVGLRYEVDLPESRQDVAEAIARGDVTGSSFWFKPTAESESRDSAGNIIYTIENLELREVGPVTFPAYEATVSEMRAKQINQMDSTNSDNDTSDQIKADDDLANSVW